MAPTGAGSAWDLFHRNGRLAVLTVGFLLVTGLAALATLGRQEDPTLTQRFAGVTTFLPGATAERVEALVSEPIETGLREIEEIAEVSSRSRAGYALVDVELADHVGPERVDVIWSEVRDRLGEIAAALPGDATEPDLEVRSIAASTLQVAFTWAGEGPAQLGLLGRLAEELSIRLANLAGTESTELHGEPREQILVEVDPAALAAVDLTAPELAARIGAGDTKRPAGRIRGRRSTLLVEVEGELDSVERIAALPLTSEPGRDGERFLRVGDVARITKVPVSPPETLALVAGRRAVVVSATMEPDLRVDRWVQGARRTVAAFAGDLPAAVAVEVIFDQDVYTSARLRELFSNLLSALALVLGVLVVLMGVRAAVTVGVALPLSIAMVLSGLALLDVPLHQMSVTGLIIALGLLIDNAIVVVEEYKLLRRGGAAPGGAVGAAVRHLIVPLLASTATTVLAFAPIAMAPGGTGEFTGTMAVSVMLSVGSSFLLAMTIVPAFAAWLDERWPPRSPASGPAPWWREGWSHPALTRAYRRSLDAVLRRPWRGVAVGLVLPLLGFGLAGTLTSQFFPPAGRDQFQMQVVLPSQASIEETRRVVARASELIEAEPGVERTVWFLGEGAPRVYYNVMIQADGVGSFASGWVDMVSGAAAEALLPRLQARLREAVPEARILALPFEQGPPVDAPIEARLVGPELDVLRRLGERLRLILSRTEGVTYTQAALSAAEPKVAVVPQANRLARVGLRMTDVPGQLGAALDGIVAGTVMEGTHELPVRVRFDDAGRGDPARLPATPLTGARRGAADFAGVPLAEVAQVRLTPAPGRIERRQGERVNTVQGFLAPYTLPAAALADFRARLEAADVALPAGYRLEFGGEEAERTESVTGLLSVFGVFLFAMVGVVVLSLNSFRKAVIIFAVGFLSVGLALFGIRLFGYPLGFMAIIGTLGLIGLAINGAIIVLAALDADPEVRAGDVERSREVVVDATRHIVSTTITTIGGFLPLIVFGAAFWGPLATAIAGGVLGSAVLALYFVPSLHRLLHRRGRDRRVPAVAPDPVPTALARRSGVPGPGRDAGTAGAGPRTLQPATPRAEG